MVRPAYIPTRDGRSIVTDDADGCARVLTISTAEFILQNHLKSAWDEAARNGSGYVANCFLSWANDISDALDRAAGFRAEAEAKHRSAA